MNFVKIKKDVSLGIFLTLRHPLTINFLFRYKYFGLLLTPLTTFYRMTLA